MSFFFSKSKPRNAPRQAAQPPKIGVASAGAKRNVATLHRSGCLACPLNSTSGSYSKIVPELASDTLVYFIGEVPGNRQANELLAECIPNGDEEFCSFDNIINCRPDTDRNPTWQELECCRSRKWKYVEQTKPKLIIGLGLPTLSAMLGSSDMEGMRGRLFAVKVGNHTCWFMPTYSPADLTKKAYDSKKPLQSKFGHALKMDLKHAFSVVGKLKKPHIETEAEIKSNVQCFDGRTGRFEDLLSLMDQAKAAPLKAVDIETQGVRPFRATAAVISVAFSFEDVNFSFAYDHPKAGWTLEQRKLIKGKLREIVADKKSTKIAHNLPFETEWFVWLFGKEIAHHASWECSQMQAHFIDERRGKQHRDEDERRETYQGLDFLCKQRFGTAFKHLFKLNKKNMAGEDLSKILLYNGVDTKYTLRLFLEQEAELIAAGLQDVYYDALPRQVTVALAQTLGVGVDQGVVNRNIKKLDAQIQPIEDEIASLKVVKQFVTDKGEYNPLSNDQSKVILRDYLKCPEVIKANSIDKGILEKIDHPLAKSLVKLRNVSKMKSTYVDKFKLDAGELVYADGLIHCNLNTTFTETGRLSSDGPNMQNFPSRNDSWIREQVVGGEGMVILAFDYGQLEACTAAMHSKDKKLVDALWEDYDIHAEWTTKLYERYPLILSEDQSISDPKQFKKLRSIVKNKLVFPAIFGAQNSSIAGYLNCPEDVIDDLMYEFWREFHGLARWQKDLMKDYYNTGVVASHNGRLRRYPLSRNQAINHPVQCLAAEIVCSAMNRLSARAIREQRWHLHPRLNIHDDLTAIVPDDDKIIEESIREYAQIMLTPPYSCVNVPLSITASVGKNWYEMTEIAKLWSHKDI